MDGHFVPNITIGYSVVEAIRKITSLPLDVHLMIENPDKFVKEFANAGADILTSIVKQRCISTERSSSLNSAELRRGFR